MKLMEKLRKKKLGNKGFSLVEMIIVIAIMAILVGIVGTQVSPYLNKAREEKDKQILSSIATAAVTFYSFNSEYFAPQENASDNGCVWYNLYTGGNNDAEFSGARGASPTGWDNNTNGSTSGVWTPEFQKLTGYNAILNDLTDDMSSAGGRSIRKILIFYNFSRTGLKYDADGEEIECPVGYVTVIALDNANKRVLEPVKVHFAKK